MNYIKIFLPLTISFCLFLAPGIAQKKKKSAKTLYENLGYKKSIPLYQNKEVMTVEDMSKIANAYRLNHDTENAEFWYSQVVGKTSDPQDVFYYAQALQNNGRYELAKEYYLKYDKMVSGSSDKRGKYLAEAIDRMNEFKHTEAQIKNESLINTGKLDFSPTYYNDGIIFVSTRGTKINTENEDKDIWTDDNFMALFYAELNENRELDNAKEFSLDLTTRYHEGPLCFSKNGERIFFTRNDYLNNKRRNAKDGTMKLQIYTAFKDGESWSTPVSLPFNTVEHEEVHPALSPDGTKLYFSSDRPGGLGGMDLYVSEFRNGTWNEPTNLGDKINSPGNEVFPFVHDDGMLYFASNGWGGLGGLDIFSTMPVQDSLWTEVFNIGTPFNSKKDDFGFILNVLKTEGYLTSARSKGKGKDDIYSFTMPANQPKKIKICAYDKETNARLENVQFEIIEQAPDLSTASINNGDMVMTLEQQAKKNEYILKFQQKGYNLPDETSSKLYNTGANGDFEAYFKEDRDYTLVATKDGYTLSEEKLTGTKLKEEGVFEFCLPMEKGNCMTLNGVVKHKRFGNAIPGATITVTNINTGDDIVVTSDSEGFFSFPCVPCENDFYFKGQKKNFNDGAHKQNTKGANCKIGSYLSTEILLDNDMGEIETIISGGAVINLDEGAVVELENIYYDFDQYYIRQDAKDELDNVVKLLQFYPGMTIELSSHTDARAPDEYNRTLSQNRANAAVDYIVSKGISRSRLVPKGYGETQLRNKCRNFVMCTEEEHQINRRTEIRVLMFDRKDIQVKHIDNKPETIDPADPNRKFIWD